MAVKQAERLFPRKAGFLSTLKLATLGGFATFGLLAACGGGGGGGAQPANIGGNAELLSVQQGRLADVYGLSTGSGTVVVELYEADVMVGPDIPDERETGSSTPDASILYDFISANPDTLQPRLLITREIGSPEFKDAFDKLDDACRVIAPLTFGADVRVQPYSVVPRNAAIRLTFSEDLGIGDDFFYQRDVTGKVTAVQNTEAIQILKIAGDPTDQDPRGDFEVISARYIAKGNQIIIDPVLLGSEGLQYGSRNQAAGLPESPDQLGSNIRLAIALEGPLALKGLNRIATGGLVGMNNSAVDAIVRDFRSGNLNDNSSDLARGFVRDPIRPRVLGQMRMYLERVDERDSVTKVLRVYKSGINHEIDRGDVLRIVDTLTGQVGATVEVLVEPTDDLGDPKVQRVDVVVRRLEAGTVDVLESLDPANRSDYPAKAGAVRDEWLRTNAPIAVLLAEYTAERPDPKNPGQFYGDDPSYFITFNPTPVQDIGSTARPNQDVSPFAGAIIRFSKPVDMNTVRALDSLFIGTRDVLSKAEIKAFLQGAGMDEALVDNARFLAKFRTPHLVFSRVFDENSQTAIRIQPTLGLYLDDAMRTAIEADKKAKPFEQWRYNYFVHVLGGSKGIKDLAGNELDFQAEASVIDSLVMPFSLDTRTLAGTTLPRFPNNQVAYVVRRFADIDEDERPSLYIPTERPDKNNNITALSFPREDMFGPIAYLTNTGELLARTAARVTKVVDNLNQLPPPSQASDLRWCPTSVLNQAQIINPTATVVFGAPLQNPLNPFGCRLQTAWREIDMSLSRTDPDDFNLDVEQMYWAPFTRANITFDEFDQMTLFLGHSEFRPEPCISALSAFPSMPSSGLRRQFWQNYVYNRTTIGGVEFQPKAHPAFVDQILTINPKDAITEPNGVNRYLPLPPFEDAKLKGFADEYFVWRDETTRIQGGVNFHVPTRMVPYPYIISPFLGGKGNYVSVVGGQAQFNRGGWYNGYNMQLTVPSRTDLLTAGLVGPIALPLLADFWVYPDSPDLPKEDPFRASGANGWQVSLAVTSSPRPDFRVFSAGFGGGSGQPVKVSPSISPNKWANASGGFTPAGGTVQAADNTVYWIMADFLKRTTVATGGFVEILNPHRMPGNPGQPHTNDPRLGPYTAAGALPDYAYDFEPSLDNLPAGTSVVPEFCGTGPVDSGTGFPWPETNNGTNPPTANNFPLDPLKAGDIWLRHFDDRLINNTQRRSWTYMYNKNVTAYTRKLNDLADTTFTNQFGGPNETFEAEDVKYFNWRFIMTNNVEADPPVSPKVESFSVSYRLVKQ